MKRFIIATLLFLLDGLFMFLFKRFPSFFFPWYKNLSKKWIALLASLSSGLKIAVWDIMFPVLIVLLIILLIRSFKKRRFLKYLLNLYLLASILAFVTVNGWMLNHYAPPLSTYINLEVKQYDEDTLYEACEYYLTKAGEYALKADRDDEGHLVRPDFYETAAKAGNAYSSLSEEYPIFDGCNVRVKRLSVVGEYLMYNGIVGIFMPVSGEAGVPYSVPSAPLAFTMCHEAAHRTSIASEQEANFAAFMACVNNDDVFFRYSGYYSAFSYTYSSLYRTDRERALELYEKYAENKGVELVKLDRRDTSAAYKKYESPLEEISDKINDTYLKTFNHESGIQSYGEVTDYLIAWYVAER